MGDPNLVTTCNFHGQEFLFKMNVLNKNLELLITDKNSGEEWQCSYDATYIENLTQKTGNYKQFDVFIAMIKSGLLRTSESVSLDLLTFEDLEMLRSRKITKSVNPPSNTLNRRYLIVTYAVEFDKIRYPLPLEYCGPPDTSILQATIKRLEQELLKVKEELVLKSNNTESRKVYYLQKRIEELTQENVQLNEEVRNLTLVLYKSKQQRNKAQMNTLQNAVMKLEKSVVSERNSHHDLVKQLKTDKKLMAMELEKVKHSERCLKIKLSKLATNNPAINSKMGVGDFFNTNKASLSSMKTMYRRKRSESPSMEDLTIRNKNSVIKRSLSNEKQNRSRSSSASSTSKYVDSCINMSDPFAETNMPLEKSIRNSRSKTKTDKFKNIPSNQVLSRNSSRSSSVGSAHRSLNNSQTHRRNKSVDLDYRKLEEKIASLQNLLKSNMTMK